MGIPLYRQIESELETRIRKGELSPGEILPSENELCTEYSTSRKTIRSALKELMKDGLVRNMAGIGWKVISREGELFLNGRSVVLLSIEQPGPFSVNRKLRIKVENAGGLFRYIPVGKDYAEDILSQVKAEQPAGVITLYHSWMDQDFIDTIKNFCCAAAFLRYQGGAGNVDCVDIDNYSSGGMLADLLFRNGHRRILLAPSLDLCRKHLSLSLSLTGSREQALKLEMEFREIGCGYNNWLVPSDSAEILSMYKQMKSEGKTPTAVICTTENAALTLILALQGAGIRVPDDVSVVCTGNTRSYPELEKTGITEITSVNIPWAKLADISFSMIADRIKGNKGEPRVHLISPELTQGDTLKKNTVKGE